MNDKEREQLDRWVSHWRSGSIHISDVTAFLERLVVESGTPDTLYAIPSEIRARIIEHVREYKQSGEASYVVSGTGEVVDRVPTIAAIAALLGAAGRNEKLPAEESRD